MVVTKIANGREKETWFSVLDFFSEQKKRRGKHIACQTFDNRTVISEAVNRQKNGGIATEFCSLFGFLIGIRDFKLCLSILNYNVTK